MYFLHNENSYKNWEVGPTKVKTPHQNKAKWKKISHVAVFGSNFPLIKEVDNFMVC